ncbi:MAG: Lar family restriction alleviation protein [Synergistaceae bacterium]|nr:Lar family restriction alleviation protein [Synergistaceae bacterium]
MSEFTKGEWTLTPQHHDNKPMYGIIAVDGSDMTTVALVEHEDDAKLLVQAPEMHRLLNEICRIYNMKAQTKMEDNPPAFMMALMAEEKAVNMIKQLLVRIDSKELTPPFTYEKELKPCPFCGGVAQLLPAYHGSSKVWRVTCSRCLSSSPSNELPVIAINHWNKRTAHLKEDS